MSKAEISLSEVSPAQIAETLLVQYGLPVGFASPPPGSGESAPHIRQLYGGYSGSNYAVRLQSQNRAVCFKVCNGYAAEEVEQQAVIMNHVWQSGFTHACRALPLKMMTKHLKQHLQTFRTSFRKTKLKLLAS